VRSRRRSGQWYELKHGKEEINAGKGEDIRFCVEKLETKGGKGLAGRLVMIKRGRGLTGVEQVLMGSFCWI